LLCPRPERPCHRAAERSDEFAPPNYSITSSARAIMRGDTINPSALAVLIIARFVYHRLYSSLAHAPRPMLSNVLFESAWVASSWRRILATRDMIIRAAEKVNIHKRFWLSTLVFFRLARRTNIFKGRIATRRAPRAAFYFARERIS
jgi:hypothetical protein